MNAAATQGITQPPLARHDSRLLDLAFAMDVTASMTPYIHSARDNIRRIVEEIVAKESSDVRLALVEYRDHPPEEDTFVTRVHDFTPRVGEMKQWLEASSAEGGGDAPEAVADALHDVLKLSWYDEATKICVLVSDAPPHGLLAARDSFPNGCPSGHDPLSIARQLAEKGVTLYVAGCEPSLVPYKDFFAALAYVTGGQYVPLSAAGALTAVIVGGAQEELSMEQWMEQVNQHVMQEVQARGEDNVNIEDLSREVMGRLNVAGSRTKKLRVNKASKAPTSDYVKAMSSCTDMASVRGHWKPAAAPPPMGPIDMMGSPPPPRFGAPPARKRKMKKNMATKKSKMATKKSKSSKTAPPPEPMEFEEDAFLGGAGGAMENTYDTTEGEVEIEQVERMVQKALMRNKISLAKK